MAPITTGAQPAAHAIHAKADQHAAAKKTAKRHAAPRKSTAPKLHARRSTTVAKRVVRTAAPYRVRAGDTLSAIAARHGISLAALLKANYFSDPNVVLSGSVVRLPQAARQQPVSKPAPHRAAPKRAKTAIPKTPVHRPHDSATVAATRAALARESVPSRTQTKALIETTARRYGVNPRLALGIGWQESGWSQRAVSPVNAIGTMQVMPQSGEWASGLVGRHLDLLDAHDNVTAGIAILRFLTSNAHDLDQAIGGYYQGLGAMQKHGPYADTRQYIRNVRTLMDRL
ncbi:lytic transglycosylase [Flexivirga caeni]|uniref:LysM peptidoglycan-binding domain-containing protein n=1 Tax=Flexivirga caeni TaxID=2294115 RepID=A0A3M9MHV3_9MICO|nr:lytic transglycosylase domain-containing protein [Flexivirga caeni]RNI24423.1 LysM peptidoglycan-binding domain-containing protein [Flexivirga caeni]